jgi:outer membrane protein assembly factor BamB
VYFCTAGGVFHGISINPLKSLWTYGQKGQSEQIHAAAVTDQIVVLGTHDKRLVGLNPADGDELWSVQLRARAESSPVIVGKLAIVGTVRGRLHAVDLESRDDMWQTDVGGQFVASPAVSDGRIVIGNDDGVLYCIGGKRK